MDDARAAHEEANRQHRELAYKALQETNDRLREALSVSEKKRQQLEVEMGFLSERLNIAIRAFNAAVSTELRRVAARLNQIGAMKPFEDGR